MSEPQIRALPELYPAILAADGPVEQVLTNAPGLKLYITLLHQLLTPPHVYNTQSNTRQNSIDWAVASAAILANALNKPVEEGKISKEMSDELGDTADKLVEKLKQTKVDKHPLATNPIRVSYNPEQWAGLAGAFDNIPEKAKAGDEEAAIIKYAEAMLRALAKSLLINLPAKSKFKKPAPPKESKKKKDDPAASKPAEDPAAPDAGQGAQSNAAQDIPQGGGKERFVIARELPPPTIDDGQPVFNKAEEVTDLKKRGSNGNNMMHAYVHISRHQAARNSSVVFGVMEGKQGALKEMKENIRTTHHNNIFTEKELDLIIPFALEAIVGNEFRSQQVDAEKERKGDEERDAVRRARFEQKQTIPLPDLHKNAYFANVKSGGANYNEDAHRNAGLFRAASTYIHNYKQNNDGNPPPATMQQRYEESLQQVIAVCAKWWADNPNRYYAYRIRVTQHIYNMMRVRFMADDAQFNDNKFRPGFFTGGSKHKRDKLKEYLTPTKGKSVGKFGNAGKAFEQKDLGARVEKSKKFAEKRKEVWEKKEAERLAKRPGAKKQQQ